jgi:hypothetical protein
VLLKGWKDGDPSGVVCCCAMDQNQGSSSKKVSLLAANREGFAPFAPFGQYMC